MVDVIRLRPREVTSSDLERLIGTAAGPGSVKLEVEYGPNLEELAEALSRVSISFRMERMTALADAARHAADQAGAVGLVRISRVARTVSVLAPGTNATALAANVARLMRLGEDALSSIWHLHDQQY